jgi:hypothetical protein
MAINSTTLLTMLNFKYHFRKHGHPQWKCEANSGPFVVLDFSLSTGSIKFPSEETYARMAKGIQ